MKFEEINLSEETKRALSDIGYVEMTEIQEKSIPQIMQGRDVIGQSKTGTGKTAAYGLPIIERIDKNDYDTQAIILCPTRELATQVTDEMRKFMKYKESIKTVCVYGGQGIEMQIRALKRGAQIIVGTPGRVMDHLRRGTVKLNNTKMVVLDEADEMLDMGFEEDMETILKEVPEDGRQTLLFSATMSPRIMKITQKYLNDPINIKIKAKELTANDIEQIEIELKQNMKDEAVTRILDVYDPKKAIIFCNTKRKVDNLIEMLQSNGYKADAIHGDKSQDQRERIMKRFKKGELKILIATDVAARGIDVDDLDLVINYDIPQEEEYYVHRIGRTGRNGNKGIAFTFVVGKEKSKIASIEKFAKIKMKIGKIPTITELNKIKFERILKEIQEIIDNQEEDNKNQEIEELFQQLLNNNDNDIKKVAKILFTIVIKSKVNSNNKKDESKINRYEEQNNNYDRGSGRMSRRNKNYNNFESINPSDFVLTDSGDVKLFLNLGKKDDIKVKDIVGSIAGNTAISGKDIGNIKLLESFSFVEVPPEYVEEVIRKMNGNKIKGKEARFEIANS